jgi:hypothetical protein
VAKSQADRRSASLGVGALILVHRDSRICHCDKWPSWIPNGVPKCLLVAQMTRDEVSALPMHICICAKPPMQNTTSFCLFTGHHKAREKVGCFGQILDDNSRCHFSSQVSACFAQKSAACTVSIASPSSFNDPASVVPRPSIYRARFKGQNGTSTKSYRQRAQ